MTKILLNFSKERANLPITSQVILELKVPLSILNANVTTQGGEILAEVSSKEVNRVVKAFRDRGVAVSIQRGIEVDEERCINCGACYSICPVDAISFKEDRSIDFDEEKCIACGLCVDTCPTRAIRV